MTPLNIVILIGEIVGLLSVLGSLLYFAFNLGSIAQQLKASTDLGVKTYNLVAKQDERIDNHDLALKDKVEKVEFLELKEKVTVLATECKMNHGGNEHE